MAESALLKNKELKDYDDEKITLINTRAVGNMPKEVVIVKSKAPELYDKYMKEIEPGGVKPQASQTAMERAQEYKSNLGTPKTYNNPTSPSFAAPDAQPQQVSTQPSASFAPAAVQSQAPAANPLGLTRVQTGPTIGDVSTTTQTTSLSPEGKKAAVAVNKAVDSQIRAQENLNKANENRELALSVQLQKDNEELETQRARIEQRRLDGDAVIKENLGRLEQARKAHADNQFKDFWDSKSGLQKASAAIGLIFGGIASGMTGQPNHAANLLSGIMDQHLQEQKAQADKLRGDVDAAQTVYSAFRSAYNDERIADNEYMQGLISSMQRRIAGIAQNSKSAEAKANGEKAIADLEVRKAEYAANSAERVVSSVNSKIEAGKNVVVDEQGRVVQPFKDRKEFQELVNNNDEIKAYKAARKDAEIFRGMMASKELQPAIMAQFIASTLQQGSFGPEFEDMIKRYDLVGKTKDQIQRYITGGVSQNLIGAIVKESERQEGLTKNRAEPAIAEYQKTAAASGYEPQLVLGGQTQADKNREIAKTLGVKAVSKTKGR